MLQRNNTPIDDVSGPGGPERTLIQGLTSLGGAAALALLVPVAILLVGSPIALTVRGLLELLLWLFPGIH